jgi:hypothetical protein
VTIAIAIPARIHHLARDRLLVGIAADRVVRVSPLILVLHHASPFTRAGASVDDGRQLFLGKRGLERYLAVFQGLHHRVLVLPANHARAFNRMGMHRDHWGAAVAFVDVEQADLVCRSCEPVEPPRPRVVPKAAEGPALP